MNKRRSRRFCRFSIEALSTLLQNANISGFFTGKIYTGKLKAVCVPGLNCYSCPGAVGSCPIGSIQGFLGQMKIKIPYYVVGLLIFFGAALGRAVCGFLCPFGWIQELIHLIPFPHKTSKFKGDRALRYLKYAVLVICVIILPAVLILTPVFCKYICPSGTIAGLILAAENSGLYGRLGGLFAGKLAILIGIILLSLIIWRPFCKYLCPLGAIYSFFNKISLYRMHLDRSKCVGCGKCENVCRMNVNPAQMPNSPECIRCGDCVKICPTGALKLGIQTGAFRMDSDHTASETGVSVGTVPADTMQ